MEEGAGGGTATPPPLTSPTPAALTGAHLFWFALVLADGKVHGMASRDRQLNFAACSLLQLLSSVLTRLPLTAAPIAGNGRDDIDSAKQGSGTEDEEEDDDEEEGEDEDDLEGYASAEEAWDQPPSAAARKPPDSFGAQVAGGGGGGWGVEELHLAALQHTWPS